MIKYIVSKNYSEKILEDEKLRLLAVEEVFENNHIIAIYSHKKIDNYLKDKDIPFEITFIEDEDWSNSWKKYLKDEWLTNNYYCTHSNQDFDDRKYIKINPAMAFGTGNHPTTKIAANLLEEICRGKTVLEIGSGSGILSILASKSGAKKVYACDNDIKTFTNFKENCVLNNINNILMWCGTSSSVNKKANIEIVVANIISSVLLKLKNDIFELKPKRIILSGILIGEKELFLNEFNTHYKIEKELSMEGWWGVMLKR